MTINGTWGYKKDDTNFKSTETLIRNLCDIASKGGNYLLNVGPDSQGVIPDGEVQRLADVGVWMKTNGEAIYGTGPTIFGAEAGSFSPTEKDKKGQPLFVPTWNWRCTTKPGKIFVEIFNWPTGSFILPAIKNKVEKAYLLAAPGQSLSVQQTPTQVSIALPAKAPDTVASVVCVEVDGQPLAVANQ
jgi:alpha-L-fucosidase